jgi:hypothetical protein
MAQCTAHAKSGSRCKQPAIPGGAVCRYHGGSAPQVRNKAAIRLASLVDPAVAKLAKTLKSKTESIALRAVQDILDRTNMKGDNLIRLLNPDAGGGSQFKLSEEQIARIERLPPDELAILLRVLGLIAEPGAVAAQGPSQLTH